LPRSLEQWLAHQSQLHPQTIDMGLERLRGVLDRLGWRQPAVPVITVAGTNGKGSVTAYCASLLRAAGYRAGTFTSPHLRDYRERIRIHDRLVTGDELVSAFERIEAARLESPVISLTFFEYNALAGFLVFDAERLDAWVLEVGMGGRLDAVNAVDATVAVVVSIGLDHQEFLGHSLEAIALEKAGIFRRGQTAVLGSRTSPPVLEDAARSAGATLKRLGVEFDVVRREGPAWDYRGSVGVLANLPAPALRGDAQYDNAASAIAAIAAIERLVVPPSAVAEGLRSVRLPGRFQVIEPSDDKPTWILDVAHNPAAAEVLARNLSLLPKRGRCFAVCGILADKDASGIGAALKWCFDAWWLASTDGARGTTAAVLAARLGGIVAAPLSLAHDIAAACEAAAAAASAHDRVVVFGSFHTVGPALDWLIAQGLLPAADQPEYT
jgi:dihydrofolate synthase/folylpolyglutamate synthase